MFGAGDVIAGIRAGGRGPDGIGVGTLGVAVSGGAGLLAGTAGHIALRQGHTGHIAGTIVAGRRPVKSRHSKSSRAFDRTGASCRDCDIEIEGCYAMGGNQPAGGCVCSLHGWPLHARRPNWLTVEAAFTVLAQRC